ncbi:MAG: hypothetical protein BGO67_13165 [Alphaproteobacteria bacterium 41-28]|nr:MAG: hypothetical protein BGO67_13165 [Alphaproteobacteria bacterium 41-28]
MLKSLHSFFLLIATFTTILNPKCISASTADMVAENKWIQENQNVISDKVGKFLETYSLNPILEPGEISFQSLGVENFGIKDGDLVQSTLIGDLVQGKKSYKSAFAILRNVKTKDVDVNLMYVSNTTVSTQLFFDMLPLMLEQLKAIGFIKANSISEIRLIYIDNLEVQPGGVKLQKWTFYNQDGSKDFKVKLTPDKKGETDFVITDSPST